MSTVIHNFLGLMYPQFRPFNPTIYRKHRLVPQGHYVFSIDKKGTPNSQILIRDADDPSLGRVYRIHPATRIDSRHVYYCRHCKPKHVSALAYVDVDYGTFVHESTSDKHTDECFLQAFDALISHQEATRKKLARYVLFDFGVTRGQRGPINFMILRDPKHQKGSPFDFSRNFLVKIAK